MFQLQRYSKNFHLTSK